MTQNTTNVPVRRNRGFTLLELVLALALGVLVVAAIGMAIHTNLRSLEARRGDIEKTQVGRAVLQLIAKDIRSSIRFQAIDTSEFENLAGALPGDASAGQIQGISGQANVVPNTASQITEAVGGEGQSAEADGATETEDAIASAAPPTYPGLYGTQYAIQIDVSRLPRPDQYEAMAANPIGFPTDIVSDVKTVAYYVQGFGLGGRPAAPQGQEPLPEESAATGAAGLVRREMDRAVASWANINGTLATFDTIGKVIAPEVTYLEFRYFDGTEWLTEWDSEALGGLPMAVYIIMAVRDPGNHRNPDFINADGQAMDETVYRMVVHLPMAEPLTDEGSEVDEFLGMEQTVP